MIDAVNAITSDQEWRAATGLPRQPSSSSHDEQEEKLPRCWLRAASKHLKILEVVLGVAEVDEKNGAPDDPRRLPFHPLHCAASQGMTSAGRILLQRYSGTGNKEDTLDDVINIPDAALGCTPLHWASVTNRLDFMLLLLDAGACVDSRDHAGRTPLYACAAFGAAEAVALLLQRGAAVDGPDHRGLTPLHAAAAGNHLDVAETLISAGAFLRKRSSVGCIPRHVAERQGHASMVELLADASREQPEGSHAAETIATVGGGDPLSWLFSQLRA